MAPFYRQFDVLGIVIAASDDDQVFDTTGNKQHAVLEKAHISGAQERPLLCIRQVCLESMLRLLHFVPVSLGNAGTCYPNFPYMVRRTLGQGLRINGDDLLVRRLQLTPYDLPRTLIRRRCYTHSIMLDCFPLKRPNDYWLSPCTSCRDKRRLGKTISSEKCLPAKALRTKSRYKLIQRLVTDRLCTIGSYLPCAEIKGLSLLGSNLAHA